MKQRVEKPDKDVAAAVTNNKKAAASKPTKSTRKRSAVVTPQTNGMAEENEIEQNGTPDAGDESSNGSEGNKPVETSNTEKEMKIANGPLVGQRKRHAGESSSLEIPNKRTKEPSAKGTKSATVRRTGVKRKKELLKVPKLPTVSGVLFVIGSNECAQLGLEEEISTKERPSKLNFPYRFVDIAAGGMHSVCLTDRGEVYTFGCNDEGALGRITEEDGSEYKAGRVEIPGVIVKVSAGDSHSAALTKTGQVYVWGNFRGSNGFLGLVSPGQNHFHPIQILPNVTVVDIASGGDHLVCLTDGGVVYTCGCAESGQLGRVANRSVGGDGRRVGLSSFLEPKAVHIGPVNSSVIAENIWTGTYNTFVKAQETGAIYGFGLNNCYQLGFESNELNSFWPKKITSFSNDLQWKSICGDQHHTLALDGTGRVYSMGDKEYGRLGLGANCERTSRPTLVQTLKDDECVDISTGSMCSFAVSKNGLAFSWGNGTNYQLGHGNDDDCFVPRSISGNFSCSWSVFRVSGGGQHTLLLANRKATSEDNEMDTD